MTQDARRRTQRFSDVRADFPYTQECVYLNTAAAGLSWRGLGLAAAEFYDGAKRRGMNGMPEWRKVADQARERIGRMMDVPAASVHFVASTTEGLNLAIQAIPFSRGDEILVAADEFSSVVLACESVRRTGAVVKKVAVSREDERVETLASAIGPATRAVAVSHVHWVTGTRVDLERLGEACRRHDALLVVDGAQGLGAVSIALGETDIYCASTFKWLIAGFGLAVLVVRDRAAERLEPAIRGYNNEIPSRSLQFSHVNYPGIFALNASLEYMERVGWSAIYEQVDGLWRELRDALAAARITIVTPDESHAGILSVLLGDAAALRDALVKDNVFVEERGGLLRISPHFYNTSADVARFVERLDHLRRDT